MRRLIEPGVSKSATIAAAVSTLLCYPRLDLWEERPYPVWYLEAAVFCAGFVLWAFVFAWHTHYTQRPVFTFQIESRVWIVATIVSLLTGLALYFFLDAALRRTTPSDYPLDLPQWLAMTSFSLGLNQLFLVFAPVAWLLRLTHQKSVAMTLTVCFGIMVLLLKTRSYPEPLPGPLLAFLIAVRLVVGVIAVGFYLRGGVILTSWCGLLIQSRHLLRIISE